MALTLVPPSKRKLTAQELSAILRKDLSSIAGIRASIQDYILRNWSIVRGGTSSSQKALFFNLRRPRKEHA